MTLTSMVRTVSGQQLRVGALVDLVGNELADQLEQRFPAAPAPREEPSLLRCPAPETQAIGSGADVTIS